jgi:hypothetical protein
MSMYDELKFLKRQINTVFVITIINTITILVVVLKS